MKASKCYTQVVFCTNTRFKCMNASETWWDISRKWPKIISIESGLILKVPVKSYKCKNKILLILTWKVFLCYYFYTTNLNLLDLLFYRFSLLNGKFRLVTTILNRLIVSSNSFIINNCPNIEIFESNDC